MEKESSRASRRNRNTRKDEKQETSVTLCVSPQVGKEKKILADRELRMVKSSLLYADHINLVSPTVNMLWTLAPLRSMSVENIAKIIPSLPSETLRLMAKSEEDAEKFRQGFADLSAIPRDHPVWLEGQQLLEPAIALARGVAEEHLGDYGPEIEAALASNAITLVDKGFDFNQGSESVLAWYQEKLLQAFSEPSSTVLLDPDTSRFARESGQQPNLAQYAASQTKRASTGTGLIERLPTFPDAPMQHVLEARDQLAEGRRAYRNAIKRFSVKLESAALDDSLPHEIHELWFDEVQPKLSELQSSVKATRVAAETGKKLWNEKTSGNSIAIVVALVAEFAELLQTPESVALAGGSLALAGTRQTIAAHSAKKKHDLVYLLEADRKLGSL